MGQENYWDVPGIGYDNISFMQFGLIISLQYKCFLQCNNNLQGLSLNTKFSALNFLVLRQPLKPCLRIFPKYKRQNETYLTSLQCEATTRIKLTNKLKKT